MFKPMVLSLAAALLLAACGSNLPLLQAQRTQSEADELQAYCRKAGLNNPETIKAEQALASASKHLKDGDEEVSASESDLAITLFRLAIARKELADVTAQVEALKQGLAKDKDQLQTSQEILGEMKSVRKP